MSEEYNVIIERGYTEKNDRIIDFLKNKIKGKYIDIGCNSGWLLSEVPNGVGVERSKIVAQRGIDRGLNIIICDATNLPFKDKEFDMAVLSCVLGQNENWQEILQEARRVAKRVVGVNDFPEKSQWGFVGGWIKSVIPPDVFPYTEKIDEERYYFEI